MNSATVDALHHKNPATPAPQHGDAFGDGDAAAAAEHGNSLAHRDGRAYDAASSQWFVRATAAFAVHLLVLLEFTELGRRAEILPVDGPRACDHHVRSGQYGCDRHDHRGTG